VDPEAFNAFEAAGWNAKAAGYDELAGQITGRMVEPLLDAADVGSGLRVLDIATGPGYAAARAAARGARVVGVDVSEAMVALAKARYPELEFRQANAEQLPFDNSAFDRVVANFALLHFGYPERAAAEFARVLSPGGRFAFTVWDVPDRARLLGVFLDAVEEAGAAPPASVPSGPPFFRFSDDEAIEELLRGSSFTDIESRSISFGFAVSSAAELWDGILAGTVRLAANIQGRSEEERRKIREAFDRLVEEYRSGTGYELPVSVKLASGRKPDE
jgi:SAM-dependent methyltransferase